MIISLILRRVIAGVLHVLVLVLQLLILRVKWVQETARSSDLSLVQRPQRCCYDYGYVGLLAL